jgi:hypothetical protein
LSAEGARPPGPNLSGKQTEDETYFCYAVFSPEPLIVQLLCFFFSKKQQPPTGERSGAVVLVCSRQNRESQHNKRRAGKPEQYQKGEYENTLCLVLFSATPLAETETRFAVSLEERIETTAGLVSAGMAQP